MRYEKPDDNFPPNLKLQTMRCAFHGAGLNPVWAINGISADLSYSVLMAQQASQLGLSFKQIQLSDEVFNEGGDGVNNHLFPNAEDYGKYIHDAMVFYNEQSSLSNLPDGRPQIAIAGFATSVEDLDNETSSLNTEEPCRRSTWNSVLSQSLFGGANNILANDIYAGPTDQIKKTGDAFFFHILTTSGIDFINSGSPDQGKKILEYEDLPDFYIKAFKSIDNLMKYDIPALCSPNSMDAWVNAFNYVQRGNYISMGSWAAGLFDGCLALKMLESQTITHAISFSFLEGADRGLVFASSNGFNGGANFTDFSIMTNGTLNSPNPTTSPGELTAKGIVLSMIGEAMSSCSTAHKIDFPNSPMLNTEYPAIYGWQFVPSSSSNARQAIILNVGETSRNLNVRQLLGLPSNAIVGIEEVNCFGTIANRDAFSLALTNNSMSTANNPLLGGTKYLYNPIAFPDGSGNAAYYAYNLFPLTHTGTNFVNYGPIQMQYDKPQMINGSYKILRPYSILRVFEIKANPVATISSNTSCGSLVGASTDSNIEYYQLEGGGTDAINCHADGAASYKWELKNMGGQVLQYKLGNNVQFSYKSGNFVIYFHAYSGADQTNEIYSTYWGITIHDPNIVSISSIQNGNLFDPDYNGDLDATSDQTINANNWWWSPTGGITEQANGTVLNINTQDVEVYPSLTTDYVAMAIDANHCYGISHYLIGITPPASVISNQNCSLAEVALTVPLPSIACSYTWTAYKWNFEETIPLSGNTNSISILKSDLEGARYVVCNVDDGSGYERNYLFNLYDVLFTNSVGQQTELFRPSFIILSKNNCYCPGDNASFIANDEFSAINSPSTTYSWSASPILTGLSSSTISTSDDFLSLYSGTVGSNGTYTITATGTQSCPDDVSETIVIDGGSSALTFDVSPNPATILRGCSVDLVSSMTAGTLSGSEALYYEWRPKTGLDINEVYNSTVTASPTINTTYTLYIKKLGITQNPVGCCTEIEVEVNVIDEDFVIEGTNLGWGPWGVSWYLESVFIPNGSHCVTGYGTVTCSKSWYWSETDPLQGGTLHFISSGVDHITYPTTGTKYIACQVDIDFSNGNYTDCNDLMAVYKIYGPSIYFGFKHEGDSTIINKDGTIFLYPNPNDGNFYLKFEGKGQEEGQLILYDLIGKECMKNEITLSVEQPFLVKLPDNIAEGIYLLVFRNNYKSSYFKIIVDKP